MHRFLIPHSCLSVRIANDRICGNLQTKEVQAVALSHWRKKCEVSALAVDAELQTLARRLFIENDTTNGRAAAIHESCGIPHKAEVKFGRKQESYEWPDPFGRGPVYENMEPSPW
jgi:hypothetical protein